MLNAVLTRCITRLDVAEQSAEAGGRKGRPYGTKSTTGDSRAWLATGEVFELAAAERELEPLLWLLRAEALVEADRSFVPVEDHPFQTQGASRERLARQGDHQSLADAAAARLFGDDQVLEIQKRPGTEAAQPFVEEGDAFDSAVQLRDEGFELFRIEDPGEEPLGFDVVWRRKFLEPCQLPVELDDARTVLRPRAANNWLPGLSDSRLAFTA